MTLAASLSAPSPVSPPRNLRLSRSCVRTKTTFIRRKTQSSSILILKLDSPHRRTDDCLARQSCHWLDQCGGHVVVTRSGNAHLTTWTIRVRASRSGEWPSLKQGNLRTERSGMKGVRGCHGPHTGSRVVVWCGTTRVGYIRRDHLRRWADHSPLRPSFELDYDHPLVSPHTIKYGGHSVGVRCPDQLAPLPAVAPRLHTHFIRRYGTCRPPQIAPRRGAVDIYYEARAELQQ